MEEGKKEEMSFAELFEANPEIPNRRFSPGDTVSGVVVNIGGDTIFVDLGGKSEGMVNLEEFLDKEGKVTVSKGQRLELRVASTQDGIHLSKGIRAHGAEAVELLREAHRNGIPVEGRVAAVNKGGFEVEISGLRAFCPVSQMELRYCEQPEDHVGQRYLFRITEIRERGKNIVLSRRVLLQEEQEKRLKDILADLNPDAEFEGKVTKLTDFGAFVDIGGIEGMVHVSEISHARIDRPSDVLQVGQSVRVKVLKVEPDRGNRKKIGLSIRALEPDAWEKGLAFREGDILRGKVGRLTDFGAFVEVAPGLEGLVHVSEISYERVAHPKKVLKEGDPVEVLVQKIDHEKRRVSLSIKDAKIKQQMAEDPGQGGEARLEVGQVMKGIVEDNKSYGLFVRLPQLGLDVRGLLPAEELSESGKGDLKKKFPRGREIQVEIISIDDRGRIRLSQKTIDEREDRKDFETFVEKGEKGSDLGTWGDVFKDLKTGGEER